jgi:hypothetical protein
LGSSSDAAEIG